MEELHPASAGAIAVGIDVARRDPEAVIVYCAPCSDREGHPVPLDRCPWQDEEA